LTATVLKVQLHTPHQAQQKILRERRRFNVIACGRRFGKTVLCSDLVVDPALDGYPTAYYAPAYPYLTEVWREVRNSVKEVTKDKSEQEKRIELITGGVIRIWSLDDPDTSRGHKYRRVVIDEAAKVPKLEEAWNNTVRPTLADFHGDAFFPSTPRGRDFFWQLYCRGMDSEHKDWASWQMPTYSNPYIDPSEIEEMRQNLPERVFQQEILAEFIEDAGGVFRGVRNAVDAGRSKNEEPIRGQKYYLGVDLARVQDFTVLSVVDKQGRQVYFERFNQISWERQKAAIIRVAQEYNAHVVLDSTGLGDPIFEAVRKSGISCEGYHLTNQSKEALIDNLAMRIEQGQTRIMDIETQTNELLAYEYEILPSRNVRMNAPSGMHDDCVIALALAEVKLDRRQERKPVQSFNYLQQNRRFEEE
jgi:hypothetical protein